MVCCSEAIFPLRWRQAIQSKWDDVDRIVDYLTALEAAVVPEMDFARRRISHRSALLIACDRPEQAAIVTLVRQLYDARSSVVHGSRLSDEKRRWLIENSAQVEIRVRQALVAAVRKVPAEEGERLRMLKALYDPTDEDRAEFVLQKFQEVRPETRREIAGKIARLLNG
jgi:hypothetical protein